MAWGPALITRALLLFYHFVEAGLLFGRQECAKFVSGALKFFANFRIHRLHHFFNTLLAGTDKLIGLFTLLRAQIEFAFCFLQKIDTGSAGRT